MSKKTREFVDQMKSGESPGLAESLKEIGGKIFDGARPMFDHGRSELAAALFAGHGHVMYGHNHQDGVEQPQHQNQESPEVENDVGREM